MKNSLLDKIKTWKIEEINVTRAWKIVLIDATIYGYPLTQFVKFFMVE